jgi:prepilin-type N-terminal cleavage/methylation domain-containing protein
LRKQKNKSGFTLIELVVVIVIIAIIYGVTSRPSSLNVVKKSSLRSAEEQLKTDLNFCRDLAMQTSEFYKIIFTLGSVNYTIYNSVVSENVWVHYKDCLPLSSPTAIYATSLNENQIIFGSSGQAYDYAQATLPSAVTIPISNDEIITLRYAQEDMHNITITPETGYVY